MGSTRSRGVATMVLLCSMLAACGGGSSPSPTAVPTVAPARSVLNVFNWDTYIDPAIVAEFERRFGVTVNYQTFESDVAMLEAVRADPSAHDLIVATDFTVETLRRETLLSPLNKGNIPNFANVDPLFVSPSYDPGSRFCVPYQWGTTGFGYNADATGRQITGWRDVFDPALAGRIALLDSQREVLGGVLILLGYSPNTTSGVEIAAARDFLIERRNQVATYAAEDGQDLLAAGEVDVAMEYSGDIFQVMEDDPALRYVIPSEGTIIWADNMCVPAGARQQALAEQFINYILEPETGAALSNFIRYSSPNQAALPLIDEADRLNPALYPAAGVRDRLFFLVDLGPEVAELYDRAWAEVLATHAATPVPR